MSDEADIFHPDVDQATALRDRAAKDGLRFEAYLPPTLAAWVLDEIIAGRLIDPSEAAFCAVKDRQALAQHPEARQALLKAVLDEALAHADAGSTVSGDEVWAKLAKRAAEGEEPPRWLKRRAQ